MIKIATNFGPSADDFETDEKRYEWQMSLRSNYLLLGDDKNFQIPIDVITSPYKIVHSNVIWLNRGELIAGSFMCNVAAGADVQHTDIDIYFKSKADADQFVQINRVHVFPHQFTHQYASTIASKGAFDNQYFNLIYGVEYSDAKDLITRFDIRACSIAYDPQFNMVYAVRGALFDAVQKRIVFNPIPHNTTVARVVKYAQKGFDMEAYQRLFFAELIRSDMYNPDLELSTGYRAVQK